MAATAVTPAGVRDGDPEALAGLCDRRGPAVLAYCEIVSGRGQPAAAAAAEAFGSFRAGVVAAADLTTLNPEALLIAATRHAAARYAGGDAPAPCARVPSLLAARADRSITLADHDWLGEHLADCWTCRAPVARFEAAERAYRDPPATTLAPETTAAIIAAMNAAAPIAGAIPEPPPAPEPIAYEAYAQPDAGSANGSAAQAPEVVYETPYGAADPLANYDPAFEAGAVHSVDQPISAYQVGDLELDEPDTERSRARREPTGVRATLLGALGKGSRPDRQAGESRVRRVPAAGTPTDQPQTAGGNRLPRPSRVAAAAATARRGRGPLRPAVVLPVALVVLVILLALVIAGVFGGDEPESTPQSFSPSTSAPANTTAAPVVVVPGATDATAAAVEKAKARSRAAARRRAARVESQDEAAAATPPPAVAAAPPPPPPPAANGAATPSRPAQQDGDGTPKIDAGRGATGAEQIAPEQDTSTVPDLAPPEEPAVAPDQ